MIYDKIIICFSLSPILTYHQPDFNAIRYFSAICYHLFNIFPALIYRKPHFLPVLIYRCPEFIIDLNYHKLLSPVEIYHQFYCYLYLKSVKNLNSCHPRILPLQFTKAICFVCFCLIVLQAH